MVISADWKKWRQYLQDNEFKIIKELIPPSVKILEIGGGDGFKSMLFHNLGYDITCVDTAPWEYQYHPVKKIEKNLLPFDSKTFDVIFSANVIPVVSDKIQFFKELDRVLKNEGILIHVVPSSWWSIFTNFWHYCLIPKFLIKSIFNNSSKTSAPQNENHVNGFPKESISYKIKRLFLHPLGENPSFLHEIFYFTKNSWIQLFKSFNYVIVEIKNEPLFFTAYGIFKNKHIECRKILGSIFPIQYYFKLKKST